MKPRLLDVVRCPACRAMLRLEEPVVRQVERAGGGMGEEVMEGRLRCVGCERPYAIREGIPRLRPLDEPGTNAVTSRTAERFGYLWDRSSVHTAGHGGSSYHVDRLAQCLSLPPPSGLVLDAGCGEGVDLVNQAKHDGVELVGVELSDGGCRMSFERSLPWASATVLQGDLRRLPFPDGTFDFIYSYGVLHHLASPTEGLRELVRVLKPGARIAAYLYEDFSDRSFVWRWLLRSVNALRGVTTRMSPQILYRLCQLGSPIVYLLFAAPYQLLRRVPGCGRLAASIPFRHAAGPFSLAGDLYDRFSAPVEHRYSRSGAVVFFQEAGLGDIMIVKERGWMVVGRKR